MTQERKLDHLHRGLAEKFDSQITGGGQANRVARREARRMRAQQTLVSRQNHDPMPSEVTVLPNGRVSLS